VIDLGWHDFQLFSMSVCRFSLGSVWVRFILALLSLVILIHLKYCFTWKHNFKLVGHIFCESAHQFDVVPLVQSCRMHWSPRSHQWGFRRSFALVEWPSTSQWPSGGRQPRSRGWPRMLVGTITQIKRQTQRQTTGNLTANEIQNGGNLKAN
jgi:hypothetical protein